jgi:chromosome segregation protein
LRTGQQQTQRQQFDAEKKVAVADTSIQNLQRSRQQVEEETKGRETQLAQLAQERAQKRPTGRKSGNAGAAAARAAANQKTAFCKRNRRRWKACARLAEQNRKLDAKRNEHDLLKSLVDKMEGYPESVKFLHNNSGWNHNAPLLSDIIYVREEYRAAVENVLEPYLNYYVVAIRWKKACKPFIFWKSKKRQSQLFFAGQHVAEEGGANGIAHAPEGTIPAMDVIEVDGEFKKLAQQLLGNVFIAAGRSVAQQQWRCDS